MSTARRAATGALVTGGLLWQPLLAAEKLGRFHKGTAGWYADQAGFFVASTVLLVGFLALRRSGVAGQRRLGRWSTWLLVLAWGLVTLGGLLQLLRVRGASDAVTGVGGLLSYPAVVCVGVAVARAHVLAGARRWVPLAQGVYMVVVILLPAMVLNSGGPPWPVEALWQLGWVAVGLAVAEPTATPTDTRRERARQDSNLRPSA